MTMLAMISIMSGVHLSSQPGRIKLITHAYCSCLVRCEIVPYLRTRAGT